MRFAKFLLQKALWSLVTIVGVVVITFWIAYVIPADPVAFMAGEGASTEQVDELRARLGLDQPLYLQLLYYFERLLQGDLGKSLFTSRPVVDDLFARLPATLELTAVALVITVLVGIPVGVISALHRNSWLDQAIRFLTVSGFAIASFWLAIMLQLYFAMYLDLLPLGQRIGVDAPPTVTGFLLVDSVIAGDGTAFWSALLHLILPAMTLAFPVTATIVRFTRAGYLDALGKPFVEYEKAMGMPRSLIVWKYILRNALTSTITQFGLVSGVLLGGSVVIERIFDWPGIGIYTVDSIIFSDYNAIIAVTLWVAIIYVVVNVIVDALHRLVDPRDVIG
jgi:peptide/nickel transport system permease protein